MIMTLDRTSDTASWYLCADPVICLEMDCRIFLSCILLTLYIMKKSGSVAFLHSSAASILDVIILGVISSSAPLILEFNVVSALLISSGSVPMGELVPISSGKLIQSHPQLIIHPYCLIHYCPIN